MQETITKTDIIDFLYSKYSLCQINGCYISCPYYNETLRGDHCAISVVINGLNKEVTRLSNRFCKKSFKNSDFVAMILPICQLNNSIELYEFNLI